MAIDAVFIYALRKELEEELTGAKIDKVQQPEKDKLLLSVRTVKGNRKLMISAGVGNARVHFTSVSVENPQEPPMFCMLMRKHLVGARILSVEQPDTERLLVFRLAVHDEMGYAVEKQLIVELMGKSSNILLVGSDGRIIDCLRRRELDLQSSRCLQPGMLYRFPEKQNKLHILGELPEDALTVSEEEVRDLDKYLLDTFTGISPLVCREIAWACGGDYRNLPKEVEQFRSFAAEGNFTPYMLSDGDLPKDMCFMPVGQYGELYTGTVFESFSLLLDSFYEKKERTERRRARSRDLLHQVKLLHGRVCRKAAAQTAELEKSLERETLRKEAELIKANLWQLKKGMSEAVVDDYYEEDCPRIRITLDPLKTPQQNAADRFKAYNKMKAAEAVLTELLEKEEKEIDYLASVMDEIERAESEADLLEIGAELNEQGYLRRNSKGKPKNPKKQEPLRFTSSDGFEILVGRNNRQNDELTTKTARRTDLWLHAQKIHGSHVIVRSFGEEIPERTVMEAANLAAYYSQARDGGKVPVDMTQVRFVKKPSGAAPGKVIYTDYTTVIASSEEPKR